MLSKNKIKLINSLKIKKYRKKYGFFIAEGKKTVEEFIKADFVPEFIVADEDFSDDFLFVKQDEFFLVSKKYMRKISDFKTPSEILCVFKMPDFELNISAIASQLTIFCDDVQDPGNLGTIIRTAAWFGISDIVCSNATTDVFNPKTIQASMGSVATVRVHYSGTETFFGKQEIRNSNIFGACLEGENIYTAQLPKHGIIVVGNEGQGIRASTANFLNRKLFIPGFAQDQKLPESLNVSVATAIMCSEFRRRTL